MKYHAFFVIFEKAVNYRWRLNFWINGGKRVKIIFPVSWFSVSYQSDKHWLVYCVLVFVVVSKLSWNDFIVLRNKSLDDCIVSNMSPTSFDTLSFRWT